MPKRILLIRFASERVLQIVEEPIFGADQQISSAVVVPINKRT